MTFQGYVGNNSLVADAKVHPYILAVNAPFTFDGFDSYCCEDRTITDYHWDFGDGSFGSGDVADHSYDTAGIYKVELTVMDDRGTESTNTVIAVVYDPEGGFVTGGGWFESPEGAFKRPRP